MIYIIEDEERPVNFWVSWAATGRLSTGTISTGHIKTGQTAYIATGHIETDTIQDNNCLRRSETLGAALLHNIMVMAIGLRHDDHHHDII